MAKTTTTMTFDPPKVKKTKTVYRYEAEAKALDLYTWKRTPSVNQ